MQSPSPSDRQSSTDRGSVARPALHLAALALITVFLTTIAYVVSEALITSVLAPVSAHGFDALSSPSDDPGNENDQLAQLAIDGNPSTSWNTQFYIGTPVFGGTKTGTGLILDMGPPNTGLPT